MVRRAMDSGEKRFGMIPHGSIWEEEGEGQAIYGTSVEIREVEVNIICLKFKSNYIFFVINNNKITSIRLKLVVGRWAFICRCIWRKNI